MKTIEIIYRRIPHVRKAVNIEVLNNNLGTVARLGLEQGCGLGLDVSVSRRSRDVPTSRLGLVSAKFSNVSVSGGNVSVSSRLSRVTFPCWLIIPIFY